MEVEMNIPCFGSKFLLISKLKA